MSLDGIVINSVVEELRAALLRGRVDKIYQYEDELLINVYNQGENYKLFISANSNHPRIYLTKEDRIHVPTPPMFCMLLRKHLGGARILNIEQVFMDRVIFIDFSSLDELGQVSEKRLIVEIMGRHSNIILIHKDSLKIIDSIKRINENISRVRQVLPGLEYKYLEADKLNPLDLNKEKFYQLLDQTKPNTQVFKFFYMNYMGIGPLISKEICHLSRIGPNRPVNSLDKNGKEKLYQAFEELVNKIKLKEFRPVLVANSYNNKYIGFHALDIEQFGSKNKEYLDSISKAIYKYYFRNSQQDRIKQKSQAITKIIETKLERSQNKLAKQKQELLEAENRDIYKVYADLISANVYHIKSGCESIEVENFYSENMEKITIPLDPKYSAIENAQRYYKKYSKLKNASKLLNKQIENTKNEINYLEQVLISIENCDRVEDLEEIREELIKEGYLKTPRKKPNKTNTQSKPLHFISQDGFDIYVGKNNRQNDYLTLRFAHREDLWFHAQKIPGSHVIVKNEGRKVPNTTIEEAASLAAYYSKGRYSSNVAIDFTERKNVSKPKGAKTGMVIYENFKTVFINPSKEKVGKLKKVEG